jgi:flagellar hook-length control protein FliK
VADEQAIANSLMWLLASAGMAKAETTPVAQAGTGADAHETPQGVTGGPEIAGAPASVPGVNVATIAAATRIRTTIAAAADRSDVDVAATPGAAGEVARQRTVTSSRGAIDKPSSGRAPAPRVSTVDMSTGAADRTAATVAASAANSAGATSLTNNAGAASPVPGVPHRAAHVVSNSPAIDVAATGPAAGAPVRTDDVVHASPVSGMPAAAVPAGIRAAADQPPAARPVAPAAAFAAVPVAESRPADARGSTTTRDGRSFDESPNAASIPRPAAALQSASVFQVPMEMRAVGGVPTSASVADVGTAQSLAAGHETDLPNQIVQAIRLQWADGVGDARITLKPEYLGELSIAIRVDHGAVSATLESAIPAVREWIDSHAPILREALAAHGLELARLTTAEQQAPERKSDDQTEPRQQPHENPRQQQQQRRRNTPDAPAFEEIA